MTAELERKAAKRRLSRAIHNALRLTDELVAGRARKIAGAGFVVARYPAQGKDRPDTDVVVLTLYVGEAYGADRFGQ